MRLSELIQQRSRGGLVPTGRRVIPKRTIRVAGIVQQEHNDGHIGIPSELDLAALAKGLRRDFERHGSFLRLRRRDLRLASWAVFYRGEGGSALSDSEELSRAFLDATMRKRAASITIALLHAFLRAYPEDALTFGLWRRSIRKLIEGSNSRRLSAWKDRINWFALFTEVDVKVACRLFKDGNDTFESACDRLGLRGDLQFRGFIERVVEDLLKRLQPPEGQTHLAEALDRVFKALDHKGSLRFPRLKSTLVSCLLGPYLGSDPSDKEVQERIRSFLQNQFGDPRIHKTGWFGIEASLIDVMRRWLVELTLSDFFDVIDATADRDHWEYRKMFWWSFLKKGYITDAWVVLGPMAARLASHSDLSRISQYGRISRGGQANHSVLLMRIAGAVIAERSHNGLCRIWHFKSTSKPEFGLKEYSNWSLTRGHQYEITHHFGDKGTWQEKLVLRLHRTFGIHPPDFEIDWGSHRWTRRCKLT